MGLIELARQFGQEIQNDDAYIKMRIAQQKLDTDRELQNLMKIFNEEKIKINEEMSKSDPDENKISILNNSIDSHYHQLMQNKNMEEYQNANKEFMEIIKRVNSIIIKSAQGENPYTADYYECGGSCGSCSGCN